VLGILVNDTEDAPPEPTVTVWMDSYDECGENCEAQIPRLDGDIRLSHLPRAKC